MDHDNGKPPRGATKPGKISQFTYERLLDEFGAGQRTTSDCVNHLVSMGYSKGQARSAVYRFRQRRGLVAKSLTTKG